jgi:hypothetical protein
MPKNLINDYSIYKIVCLDPNITDIYVGSTANFNSRRYQHKSSCNNPNSKIYNLYLYKFIRANGGWKNWIMVEISVFNQLTNREATKFENDICKELHATLNMIASYTSSEDKQLYHKNYRDTHKEQIKDYRDTHKEQIKDYRDTHTEQIQLYRDIYKDKQTLINHKKITCECGCIIIKNAIKAHILTKKHIDLMSH